MPSASYFKKISIFILCCLTSTLLSAKDTKEKNEADLQAIYASAFGAKKKMPAQLSLTLLIANTELTTIKVFSKNRKNITHIERKKFISAITPYVKPKYLQALQKKIGNTSKISLTRLASFNFHTKFDQNSLSLKLLVPAKMRTTITLRLGQKNRKIIRYPDKEDLAQAATISGYTNITANIDHDYNNGTTQQRLQANATLNMQGVVLESQHSWRNDRDKRWSRDASKVVIDKPESLHRYTIGDISSEQKNYQRAIHLGGFSLRKTTALNPYKETQLSTNKTFQLEEDSEVKIYINDFLKATKKLDAGEYTLTDLHFESGANTIRLEITDKDGQRSEKEFSVLNDSRLLQPGISSYALEIGKPSYYANNEHQYDTDTTVVSGYYKQGINETVTASASFVGDKDNIQLGVNGLIATPIGGITAKVGAVKAKNKKARYAIGSRYSYRAPSAKKGISFSVAGDYFEEDFSALEYSQEKNQLSTASNKTESRIYASMSKPLGNRLQGSLNIQRETRYDQKDANYSSSLNLRKSFHGGRSISARLRYQNNKEKDKSISIRLRYPFEKENKRSRDRSATLSYNSLDDRVISSFFVAPKTNIGKDSLAGSITHSSNQDSKSLSGNMSYRGDMMEIGVSHTISQSANNTDYRQRSKAKFKTALSFADNTIAISKPIRNSFAIITGPQNQDKDIAAVKGRSSFSRSDGKDLPDYYQSVVTTSGKPAVINLPNYRYNSVNVDSTALPRGSDPDYSEFELKPAYKQGYVLKAGGEAGVIVDGVLKNNKGEPFSLAGGQLIPLNTSKKKAITFFTNRSGKFRLISVPAGKYQIELFDLKENNKQVIDIPNTPGELYKLGELTLSGTLEDS